MTIRFTFSDPDGVVEAMEAHVDQLENVEALLQSLRDPFWRSRVAVWDTQGEASGTPWPLYSDTEEAQRYIYAKGAILGMDEPVGDDDVLMWGGPSRLREGATGVSSESSYTVSGNVAEAAIEVPHARDHDQGEGEAPEWAWLRGTTPYQIPQRRLSALGGDGPDAFQNLFAQAVSQYLGDTGARLGLKTDDLRRQLVDTYGWEDTVQ